MDRAKRFHFPALPNALTLGLIAVVIAAFGLRIFGLDWDEGRILHPDELHVIEVTATRISFEWPPNLGNLLDPDSSRLNPRSDDPDTGRPRQYAYGALPVLVTDLSAELLTAITGTDWTLVFGRLYKVGRFLSATFDTATVVVTFLIGRRLFGPIVGLLASTLYALAPMAIQLAHFYTTDSWLTFFVALTLWHTLRAVDHHSFGRFAAAGAGGGLAMATKGSVITLLIVVGLAALFVGWRQWQRGEFLDESLWIAVSRSGIAAIAAILGFGLFEPYALARPLVYLDQLRVQSGIVRGTLDATYTRQYVGTVPFFYQLEQLFRWAIGPVATVMIALGVIFFVLRLREKLDVPAMVIGSWILLQGAVVILPETKFVRYVAPLLPALVVLGAAALNHLRHRVSVRFGRPWSLATLGLALVLVSLWTAGFSSVYAAPNTRLEASRWIYANVPNGVRIGVESWDDALPVALGTGLTPWDFQYRTVSFDLYGDRPPEKVADDLYVSLEASDYLVLASNRVQRGVSQLPWRYPVQIRYYDLLETERLGYELVAEFRQSPRIGPIRLDDRSADESLINYDHPHVRIFKRTELIPRASYDQLMAHAIQTPVERSRSEPDSLKLNQPVGDLSVVNDTRWSASLTENSAVALLVWIGLLILLQIVGRPIAALVFSRFADEGWSFARLLALLLAGYVVWIGASLHLFAFRAIWCWVAILLVASSWLLARRDKDYNQPRRRYRRTAAFASEGVFWAVFVVFLLFRLVNPDSWHPLWGGEKPMEFAHLNAILRSAHFPPFDPWFADGYINYYYYGLYLVAFCIKLTGIPSEIAFNLAQPTLLALLASAGFGLAATLGRRLVSRPTIALVGGFAGTILLVAIGNLEAFVRVIRTFPDSYQPGFALTWEASRVIPFTINEFPFFTGLYADLHAHVVALPITILVASLCYAVASQPRLAIVALSGGRSRRTARVTLGIRLALLTLSLGALFPTNAWDVPVYAALTAVAVFMATSVWRGLAFRLSLTLLLTAAVGGISYLLYLPFHSHYVALFGSLERVRTTTGFWVFLDHFGGLLAIAACGLVLLLIGSARNLPLPGGLTFLPLVGIIVTLTWASTVADHSSNLLSTLNLVLVALVAIQLILVAQPDQTRSPATTGFILSVLTIGAVATMVALLSDRLPLALMCVFATAGVALWALGRGSADRFLGAMVAAAAGVAGGVEIVFLADDLITIDWYRMNTVFKFYNQVWVLLAIVGGAVIARMVDLAQRPTVKLPNPVGPQLSLISPPLLTDDEQVTDPPPAVAQISPPRSSLLVQQRWAVIGLFVSGLVILASAAYPLLATKPRLELRFPNHPPVGTLNGLAWMDDASLPLENGGRLEFDEDRAAIEWLNSHVDGSPVIAEASIGPYRCNGSRISIHTGLPTIIGWERHQTQQRYVDGLSERVQDVKTLYASTDPTEKRDILRRYDVRYVIVGQLERAYPQISGNDCLATNPDVGIAAFESMVGTTLEVAFQRGSTIIYRVLPPPTTSATLD